MGVTNHWSHYAMQVYSDPSRESDPYALPDVEVFQLTAAEVAELDDDSISEFMHRPEFRLASMNSRARGAMIDAMIEELGITGGWFYQFCLPGCLPDSEPYGPYATAAEARQAAIDDCAD
jgi:hypothetical protein